jgi:hypothetical protein
MYFKILLAAGLVSITGASAQTFPKQCAAEDLRLVIAIEQHGEAGDIAPANLAAAWSSLLAARTTCRAGNVTDAMHMYGNVSLLSAEAAAAPRPLR